MPDLQELPVLGVGLEYWVASGAPPAAGLAIPSLFDYVEIQPPHWIFDPGLLQALAPTRVLLHSSDLSLASVGMEMDAEYLTLTHRLLRSTASPWLSEHIWGNCFPGGDTRHFVLPFLGDEVRDTVIANARLLHRRTGLPVLLENAPRTLIVDMPGDAPEAVFMHEVLEGAGAGLVLDLDNARATAWAKGQPLQDYLQGLPLERTAEIHVHDPVADTVLLWHLMELPNVRAVTVGWSMRDRDDAALHQTVQALKACLHSKPRRLHAQGQVTEPAAQAGAAPPEDLYRLAPGVALSLRDGRLRLSGGAAAVQLELDLRCLPLVSHFATPQTLASALLLPQLESQESMLEASGVLRGLLDMGVLAIHTPQAHEETDGRGPAGNGIWPDWDAALDFHLATRTRQSTPFYSVDAMEHILCDRAKEQAQVSAYKDYASHPFFALPNPLEFQPDKAAGFLDVLTRRRSLRAFTEEPLRAEELSALLFYVWGATTVRRNDLGDVFLQKTAPAGGSLHGAEVYPLLLNVQGYDAGLYHYSVRRHGLELLSREDPRSWIAQACGGQEWIADAAAVFLSTYCVKRLAWKYNSSRGLRAALLDTGHLGQSFALVSTWLQLAPFTTAALRDEVFEDKLGLDYLSDPVLMLNGVGRPAPAVVLPDRPRARSIDNSMP